MDATLRQALRRNRELRNQLENLLLGDDGDMWEAELRKFVARRPCWVKNKPDSNTMTFGEFFRTREGLWVSDDFVRLVLSKAKSMAPVDVKHVDLPRHMTDTEIEQELFGPKVFTEDEVCTILQNLIEEQWGGKSGKLLHKSHSNLFYTSSCVVYVSWFVDDSEWNVDAWYCNDNDGWCANHRAFVRN